MILVDRGRLRTPIDGRRGRENESPDSCGANRLEECNSGSDIGIKEGARVGNRFRYESLGREVKDGIKPVLPQQRSEFIPVADIQLIKSRTLRHGGCMSGREIIDHRNLMALLKQTRTADRTDISRPTSDQDSGHN